MARLARLVVPGLPHHVTQRGNRRMQTFFSEDDYRAYLKLLAEACADSGVACWAYCLMPNHVHLILVPPRTRRPARANRPAGPAPADSLRATLGEAHRRYSRRINLREDWRGHLWQERFHSFVMDEPHLIACARYVEQNPVKAGLVRRARDWPWSSARAHLAGRDDGLCEVAPLIERAAGWLGKDWRALLAGKTPAETLERLRGHARSGRPLGDAAFVADLDAATGRRLAPRRPGRPRNEENWGQYINYCRRPAFKPRKPVLQAVARASEISILSPINSSPAPSSGSPARRAAGDRASSSFGRRKSGGTGRP